MLYAYIGVYIYLYFFFKTRNVFQLPPKKEIMTNIFAFIDLQAHQVFFILCWFPGLLRLFISNTFFPCMPRTGVLVLFIPLNLTEA